MKNISLKQWIIAGTLSGVVIGIFVFIILYLLFSFPIYTYESFIGMFPSLLGLSFVSNVFLGVIAGTILSFMYNKLPLKRRLLTCSLISMVTVTLMVFSFALFLFFIPFSFIAAIHIAMWGFLGELFGVNSLFVFLPTPLIGVAFGFLINYFITRMERKASK